MDAIDRKILMILQKDGKCNTKEIANRVGLSVTPTYERIKKLERKKVITSYVALVDRRQVGKHVIAYCQVTLVKHQKTLSDDFKAAISSLPEVMECHQVSGNYDYLLKIVVGSIEEFHVFINEKLSVVDGISTIHSSFVLNSVIDQRGYVL